MYNTVIIPLIAIKYTTPDIAIKMIQEINGKKKQLNLLALLDFFWMKYNGIKIKTVKSNNRK
jgi:hypothetical protein